MVKHLLTLMCMCMAYTAHAATWTSLNVNNPGFNYQTSPANAIWFYNDNINPQNAANIQSVTEDVFGLVAGSLNYIGQCDTAGSSGSCSSGTSSNTKGSFTSTNPFNYLAVHLGKQELLFYWESAITSFTLEDIEGGVELKGISNYRAYSTSAVPLPSSLWMLIGGLGFISILKRRLPH